MKNIYHQIIRKNILMMTDVEISQNKRLDRSTIENINLLIQINII